MKNKKPLWIALIALDVGLTIFLFVVHIMMIATLASQEDPNQVPQRPRREGMARLLWLREGVVRSQGRSGEYQ